MNGITIVEFVRLLSTAESSSSGPDVAISPTATLPWIYALHTSNDPNPSNPASLLQHNSINFGASFSLQTGGTFAGTCPGNCTDSSRGVCNSATSVCECFDDFFGDDCSKVKICTTNNDCSNRGTCNLQTFECQCPSEWIGSNCATPAPPRF